MSSPAVRRACSSALALLSAACSAGERPVPMTRLGGAGAAQQSLRFEDETRPVMLLRSGEVRRFRARVEPGSRAVFALALLEQAPPRGIVHLEVSAGGRTVFHDRVSVKRPGHWFHRSARLGATGDVEIAFRVFHGRADGSPLPREGGEPPAEPWIALSLPRLYRPGAGPGRVFVWISQDTLRADHLGSYGYARDTSPRFDRRAQEWTLFESASASSSWTLPSMASQFLSRHPSHHGCVLHDLRPQAGLTSVFEALAADGFTVLGVTGNDFISSSYDLERGFDVLHYREGLAQDTAALLRRLLDEWHGGDLALFVHFMDPHSPYLPPGPFRFRFHDPHPGGEPDTGFEQLSRLRDPERIEHVLALYDGEIAYTDAVIGDLLDELEARGLLDRAVIAYSADHGEELGDHGSWHHGSTLYEEVLHVPFALRVPGLPPGRVAAPMSLVDLAPTALQALGVAAPATYQGASLMPAIAGSGRAPGRDVIAETHLDDRAGPVLALRRGPLKLILRAPHGADAAGGVSEQRLFDLASDPAERRNLWGGRMGATLAAPALEYLEQARAHGAAPRPVGPRSAETLERLRALGYVR